MNKLLKVLSKNLTSPYKMFRYELGKVYHCNNFDESNKDCSTGFYAVDFNGLSYAYRKDKTIHEVEVWGKEKEFNQFKRRYEYIKIGRELSREEIEIGLLKANESEGYNVLESVFPVNPLEIEPKISIEEAVELAKEWASVRNSVRYSVYNSVYNSVWTSVYNSVGYSIEDSVWDSVGGSVRDSVSASVFSSVYYSVYNSVWDSVYYSVWDSVWDSVVDSVEYSLLAYISFLFPNIKKWDDVDHEPGVNPFQSGIDLWRAGYISSFDGNKWRLHTKDGIVWEEQG